MELVVFALAVSIITSSSSISFSITTIRQSFLCLKLMLSNDNNGIPLLRR